jgi:hypothetical protein
MKQREDSTLLKLNQSPASLAEAINHFNTRAVDPALQKRMEQFSLRQLTQSGLSRDPVIRARRGARVHPDSRARLEETVNQLERQLVIRNSSQHRRMGR